MRFASTENPFIWVKFNTGDTATITIYYASDNSVIINAAAMSELGITGYFKYNFDPSPTGLTNYFYVASTDTEEQAGAFTLGGYPDDILSDTNELQTNQNNWTTATGFAVPNEYDTELAAITEDTERIAYLSSGTTATSVVARAAVITAGVETNDYTVTKELDTVVHTITQSGGVIDFYYQFNVGANGVPVSIVWEGYANNKSDNFSIFAWNWDDGSWDQVGSFIGINGTDIIKTTFSLTIGHVGTGSNQGEVEIRGYSTDGISVSVDRILCSYATIYQSVGYAKGSVWFDSSVDNENTVSYIDGVADNPVSTVTAALTISSQTNIKSYEVTNGSLVVLPSNCDNFTANGYEWDCDLNNQSCNNTFFAGANVSGTCTGDGTTFKQCTLCSITAEDIHAYNCALCGELNLSAGGGYSFDNCFSIMTGEDLPVINVISVDIVSVKMRHYSGGIIIKNLKDGDNFNLDGQGQLVIDSSCTGGSITIRGSFTITDNTVSGFVAGGGEIIDDARYEISKVSAATNQAIIDGALTDNIVTAIENSVTEGTLTNIQMKRIMFAALAGLCSGGGSELVNFRDLADSKNRISATVDDSGNRFSINLDGDE